MSYASEQDADSPLSRWQFNETSGTTIDDDKTSTRDGTIVGGVTLNQSSAPGVGAGALFDGTSGYVTMGNFSGLLGIGTIETVCTFTSVPTSSNVNPLFSHAYSSSIIPLVLGFSLDGAQNGKLQVGYYTGSTWQTATWATPPSINTVYHLVGKYDGTTLKLRANGVEVATTTVGTARPGSGTVQATAYIGRRWDLAQYHAGMIYDLALYSTALSDARSDVHYAALTILDDAFPGQTFTNNSFLTITDTTTFSTETSEPGSMDRTAWATFRPTGNGTYRISTVGSSYDTKLAIYTGSALGSLSLVASDDNSGASNTSVIDVALAAGTNYRIQAGAQTGGAGGTLNLALSQLDYTGSTVTDVAASASPTTRNGHVYKGRLTKAEDLSGVS